jgi:hypothetical protein
MKKVAVICFSLLVPALARSADFFCADVTCLAAAINESNQTPEDDAIFLLAETFTLQAPLPRISGPGGRRLEILGLPSVIERHPEAEPFSIFQIGSTTPGPTEVHLTNITVKGGDPFGIDAFHVRLRLDSVTLTDNRIGLSASGLFISPPVNVRFARISGNQTGVRVVGVTVSLFSVLLEHNQTPLVLSGFPDFSAAEIRNTTFRDNEGGIFTDTTTQLILIDSAFIRNRGSIFILHDFENRIENTTIAFNETENGAIGCGQGIFGGCSVTILNSTITANRGRFTGGITSIPGRGRPIIEIQNSIVAGNTTDEGSNPDCETAGFPENIRSLGNNIVGLCEFSQQPSDILDDPRLGAFVDVDSPRGRSHFPLRFDSPAIDSANPEACPPTDQLANPRLGICDIGSVEFQGGRMLVNIDIRPRSDANRINPNSSGNINVAILSGNGFDARTIDPNTIRFGATGTEAAPVNIARRDVDGDGDRDVVARFLIQDTGIRCGDPSATLTGQISNGVTIVGSSPIRTVQC